MDSAAGVGYLATLQDGCNLNSGHGQLVGGQAVDNWIGWESPRLAGPACCAGEGSDGDALTAAANN